MAVVVYDDEWGARVTNLFGCSLKTISVQMGFNSQPIVFSVTVIKDVDQVFDLTQKDIHTLQYVSFGELSILGIVQSWERTTVGAHGSDIYVVRLIDCRTVLDSKKIVNLTTYYRGTADVVHNGLVTTLTEEGCTQITRTKRTFPGQEAETIEGATFDKFICRVQSAPIEYGGDLFEVDMTDLFDLTDMHGNGIEQFFVAGKVRSITSIISDFCNSVGAEWWVESSRKSVVDDTVIIKIKVIRRLDKLDNPNSIEMDALAALHDNRIISRKEGYELNDEAVTNVAIWGGMKQKLYKAHGGVVKQFWGFDEQDVPLETPSYVQFGDPPDRRTELTLENMESVINGDLDGSWNEDQLSALKQYLNNYWGKKFYFPLEKSIMSESQDPMPFYPEITAVGWWEGIGQPQGVLQFGVDAHNKLANADGRWGPFVELSNLFSTDEGDVNYVQWSPATQNSVNLMMLSGKGYLQCRLTQHGRYVVMSLPIFLTRYFQDHTTGEIDRTRFTRDNTLSSAWVPLIDRAVHYGPWTNTTLRDNDVPRPGRTEASIDRTLVPWAFGENNITHTAAMEELENLANQKMNLTASLPTLSTGQLEVAGIPAVNIGQALGLGGSITDVFVRFDQNGVTTRYLSNLYTRELGEFKRHKRQELEKKEMIEEQETDEECPTDEEEAEVIVTEPVQEDEQAAEEEGEGPTQEILSATADKMTGGMGIVTYKEGGPFYSVRRMTDLDFAGSLLSPSMEFYFQSDWHEVRNLAETTSSPGLIPVGTRVTVSIFSESEMGPFIPYMEQTPQVFTPPVVEES